MKIGCAIPDAIWERIKMMEEVVRDCKPFDRLDCEENQDMICVCKRDAGKILELIEALNKIHGQEGQK